MKVRVWLDDYACQPTRSHTTDAGYDLCSQDNETLYVNDSMEFDTGVHMQIPYGYAGIIIGRSGLNVNHGIHVHGLVDSNYLGSIKVRLYNHGDEPYKVKAGDRIAQIMFVQLPVTELELWDKASRGERGSKGYGSSGQ